MNKFSKYKPVIGLEIHVELKTKSKMFCQCESDYFGKPPNSNTCPVCLGLPGALPVPNKKAVEWTILIGKALNCKINSVSKFDRKHYFYPDLPKGYQISQYDEPIAVNGRIVIPNSFRDLNSENQMLNQVQHDTKKVGITRVHLEEDTGKLLHIGQNTLVDFNRSGVPLVEIVTEPDFDNSDDVKQFLEELQVIIRYLGVSDADMEKGSMRLEPNISVKNSNPQGLIKSEPGNPEGLHKLPNYKVEIKNINSFRFVKQAIDYEVERQIEILERGDTPIQETRGFDEKKVRTYSQRTKEEAHDYRYFPEPDIPPMVFSNEYVKKIEKQLPELPQKKIDRYINKLFLRYQDAYTLSKDKATALYYDNVVNKLLSNEILVKIITAQQIANLIINKKLPVTLPVEQFLKKAKDLLAPKKTDEKALDTLIKHLIEVNKKAVDDFKKGKENAVMFLVGAVMREMRGKADARLVKELIIKKLR